jgi:hypothetical protein
MRKINKVLLGVTVSGCAAAALIGSGAGATFNDAVHVNQTINSGVLDLTVTGPGVTSADGKTLALPAVAPTGSSFTTGAQTVTIANVGSVDATQVLLSATATWANPAGATLQNEVGVKVVQGGSTLYAGPLTGLENTPVTLSGTIAQGTSKNIKVTFFAGSGGVDSLTDAAQGGQATPSLTFSFQG